MDDTASLGIISQTPPPQTLSPDAVLFAALIRAVPQQRRTEPPTQSAELQDLVLRLASAVRQTTVALRDASACLAAGQGMPRLPQLLARAEAASLEQAACTTALIRHLAPILEAA